MSKNLSNSEHEVIGITSEPAEACKTSDSLYYEGMMAMYRKAKQAQDRRYEFKPKISKNTDVILKSARENRKPIFDQERLAQMVNEVKDKKLKQREEEDQKGEERKLKKKELNSFIKRNYHDFQQKKKKNKNSQSPFKFKPDIDTHSKELAEEVKKKRNKDVFSSLFQQANLKRERQSEHHENAKRQREEDEMNHPFKPQLQAFYDAKIYGQKGGEELQKQKLSYAQMHQVKQILQNDDKREIAIRRLLGEGLGVEEVNEITLNLSTTTVGAVGGQQQRQENKELKGRRKSEILEEKARKKDHVQRTETTAYPTTSDSQDMSQLQLSEIKRMYVQQHQEVKEVARFESSESKEHFTFGGSSQQSQTKQRDEKEEEAAFKQLESLQNISMIPKNESPSQISDFQSPKKEERKEQKKRPEEEQEEEVDSIPSVQDISEYYKEAKEPESLGLDNLDAFDMEDYEQYAAEALARSENLIEQRDTNQEEDSTSYRQERIELMNTEEESKSGRNVSNNSPPTMVHLIDSEVSSALAESPENESERMMKSLTRQGPNNTLNGSKQSAGLMLISPGAIDTSSVFKTPTAMQQLPTQLIDSGISSIESGKVNALVLEEDDKGPAPFIEPAEQEKNIDMTASQKGLTVIMEEMEGGEISRFDLSERSHDRKVEESAESSPGYRSGNTINVLRIVNTIEGDDTLNSGQAVNTPQTLHVSMDIPLDSVNGSHRKFHSNPINEEVNSQAKSSFLESEMSVVEEEKGEESLGATLQLVSYQPSAIEEKEPDIEEEFDMIEKDASRFLRELYGL